MAKKIFDFDTELNFGKHKGKTPGELLESGDASYLAWVADNVNWAEFEDELYDEIFEMVEGQKDRQDYYDGRDY